MTRVAREVVVLVDECGAVRGTANKADAHEPPGTLHLAFSVVLYRADGLLLVQQRAKHKYHFPLFWANACCSHPGPGEDVRDSAIRRVEEELGFHAELAFAGRFVYRASCPVSGLVEHELDHVFFGVVPDEIAVAPNPDEVASVAFVDGAALRAGTLGLSVTPWLRPAVDLADARRVEGAPRLVM